MGPINKHRRGWAGAQRGWDTMFSAFPMGWAMLFSASGRGGSSYSKPWILKYCKLPKPSVGVGALKSLQNLHRTHRKRPNEQTEPYKLNFGSLQYYLLKTSQSTLLITITESQRAIQLRTCSGEHQPIVTSKWLKININYYKYKYYMQGFPLRPEAGRTCGPLAWKVRCFHTK